MKIRYVAGMIALWLAGCAAPDYARLGRDAPDPAAILDAYISVTQTPNTDPAGLARIDPRAAEVPPDNSVTWLGHSSFLIRVGAKVFLSDPLFAEQLYGPLTLGQRLVPLPELVAHIDQLDGIFLSHGHIDHAHPATLRALTKRFPEAPVLVPRSAVSRLSAIGVPRIRPFDARRTQALGDIRLTLLPVPHEELLVELGGPMRWQASAFVIEHGANRIYLAGDTSYGDHGRAARARFGPMTLALLPVGAWDPSEIFDPAHETPEQAVQLAADLGAPQVIGHHWGTYAWTRESAAEVRARFLAAGRHGTQPLLLNLGAPYMLR